ncbi:DUF3375 domain-containing protein [Nocardioides pacificus]
MSGIVAELARVTEAFDRPTLRLLDRKWAPLVLSVFRTSFSSDVRTVHADRLHTQVDAYLDELRLAGVEVPPNQSGRSLCLRWMGDQWLYRTLDEDGDEEYSLTSHAVDALDLVQSLTRDRALISGSRINTIVDAVRRWATEANPDREARVARLDEQIERLTAERDRIEAGGEIEPASIDDMQTGYVDLMDLIGQLPGDFKRVEESVAAMHRKIVRDFREEDRPIGEVLDEYLRRSDELLEATQEGRAFEGAFELLRDKDLLDELGRDIQAILEHPFAHGLGPDDHRDFRGTVAVIRRGIDDVLARRTRLSSTLREHIVHHDVARDREVDQTLRHIERLLVTWMETTGPRSRVEVELIPGTFHLPHLRERFHDPATDVAPESLPVTEPADVAVGLSIEQLRQQGGPSLSELRDLLSGAISDGDLASAADVFNQLPDELRRPVEIVGMLHLLTQWDATPDKQATDRFEAIRPDGSRRVFDTPVLRLPSQGSPPSTPATATEGPVDA